MDNPFLNVGYISPLYFCDRERETQELWDSVDGHHSITLHSIRRMGKTGQIHHLFYTLRKRPRKYLPIYVDIYDTKDEAAFVNALVSAVLPTVERRSSLIGKVSQFFGRYRPAISVDNLTGNPSVRLEIRDSEDVKISLDTLFGMIGSTVKRQVVLAIDEFQQIESYGDSLIAASLRKHLQQMPNLTFLFSGSEQHMLMELFGSPKKALFNTTQLYPLGKIDPDAYHQFIIFHFKQGLRSISSSIVDDILDWTKGHTYYTQTVCQRLYSMTSKSVEKADLERVKYQLLKEHEAVFHTYRSILSRAQWKLLSAIGQAGKVSAPTSSGFISRYNLGSHSTVRQSLRSLGRRSVDLCYTRCAHGQTCVSSLQCVFVSLAGALRLSAVQI